MDEKLSQAAVMKHMDEIKTAVNWVLGLALVASLFALQKSNELTFLEMEMGRETAFWAIALVYVAFTAAVAVHFARIRKHFRSIPPTQLNESFSLLQSHEWLLNPYVAYGGKKKRRSRYWGLSALVAVFWVGLSGLFTLVYPLQPWLPWVTPEPPVSTLSKLESIGELAKIYAHLIPVMIFLGIGYLAMHVVLTIPSEAAARVASSDPSCAARLRSLGPDLKKAADLGIGVGGGIYCVFLAMPGLLYWLKSLQ